MDAAWIRDSRLIALVQERDLKTKSFPTAMLNLVRTVMKPVFESQEEECREEGIDFEKFCKDGFGEWFGGYGITCKPPAFRICHDTDTEPNRAWNYTVELYEVENSREVPPEKLREYGWWADSEGPHFDLHILDKYDNEIVIDGDTLMRFTTRTPGTREYVELCKEARAKTVAQHHTVLLQDPDQARQIRVMKRQLALIDHSRIVQLLKEIVYGLGSGQPHAVISSRLEIDPILIRGVNRVLMSKNIEPKELISATHRKWKVAFDALRELGIEV